jgi:hydroxypyruvate isomerase
MFGDSAFVRLPPDGVLCTLRGMPQPKKLSKDASRGFSRRGFLQTSIILSCISAPAVIAATAGDDVSPDYRVRNKRIHQSIMGWTFEPMATPELAKHCRNIGIVAMEGIDAKYYPMVRDLGLKVSLTSSHGFAEGPYNPANHPMVISKLREGIDLAVAVDCRNVITFTGMREPHIDPEQGAKNCVDCWKNVISYAEEKKVNVCLEHLNTRDNTHPMKGHPGYFGDDVDFCVGLIEQVGSPNMKLLFDIYHVQVMNGDVIRRIRRYKDVIGHYHTAGVPGRAELDENQEVNYPAVMRAILETGYTGYVAQEFIPTWPDRVRALRHAAFVCDV